MPTAKTPSMEKIKRQVVKLYPDMTGVEPTLVNRQQPAPPAIYKKLNMPQPHGIAIEQSQYVYVFKKTVQTADGTSFQRIVRAVVSKEGRLIRTTTSK